LNGAQSLRVDAQALKEVQRQSEAEPRRCDLLIKQLHKIQDNLGHLTLAHLAA